MADTLETDITSADSVVEQEAAALGPWFHNLHLPDGTQTAPHHRLGDFPSFKWDALEALLPEDLSGWTALDIGCNAGFYTFELAKRGATVLGIDVEDRYLKQARWAARKFEMEHAVEFERMQVYELARSDRTFDLILFLGVFYHLRYPLLALDILSRKVKQALVFQSLTIPGEGEVDGRADNDFDDRDPLAGAGWPKMAFVEERFAGDPTNWWVPNRAGVEAMLRSSGLRVTSGPAQDIYVCERADAPLTDAQHFIKSQLSAATGAK